MSSEKKCVTFKNRFRGFLPVVIDVETGGLAAQTDALLEIAAVMINMNDEGELSIGETHSCHVTPFEGAVLDPKSLEINRIDPYHPFRLAVPESKALAHIFQPIHETVKAQQCQRAVLVGHNSWFDLAFMLAAVKRCKLKDQPFHSFTSLDTATLSALVYGETVLQKALKKAGIQFDPNEAHSAIYDANVTAELFCRIFNTWRDRSTLIP
ncbi:MAG: ribonuclease T [Pseudomonadota bacterium]|nr:ribonuclease T [Pseudomonadota bacterium]